MIDNFSGIDKEGMMTEACGATKSKSNRSGNL